MWKYSKSVFFILFFQNITNALLYFQYLQTGSITVFSALSLAEAVPTSQLPPDSNDRQRPLPSVAHGRVLASSPAILPSIELIFHTNMIGATRRWFQRNRKGLAIGAGVLGAGYLAGQYLLSKISEARERMSSDRIAREK